MTKLKSDLCDLITTSLISSSNCILFYLDACKFNCKDLRVACEDMMVRNFAEAIIDQREALLHLPVQNLMHICEHDKLNLEHEY